MREFEGFVFDLDNTAVAEGSLTVPEGPLLEAFHSLDPNIPVMAATGRSLEFALPITRAFKLSHESIVANGAQIVDSYSGEVLEQRTLSFNQVRAIIDICRQHDDTVRLCIAGDPMDAFYTAQQQSPRETPGVFIVDLDRGMADALSSSLSQIENITSYTSESIEQGVAKYDVNIGSLEAEKGRALLRLLSRKAIDPMNMIVVGDSINDVSLFDVAGYSVAMANAHPSLLERADEIVPAQSQDGLLEIVKHFL